MSKAISNDIFLLIRSMSKNEKGYFKKFASRHTIGDENIHILLFDLIERQEEYNEEEILEKIAHRNFAGHFAVHKNHLYHLILRSLNIYHSGKTTNSRLSEIMISVDILTDKALFVQARKLLAKAREIATENQKLSRLPEINGREIDIRRYELNAPEYEIATEDIYKSGIQTYLDLAQQTKYEWLHRQILDFTKDRGLSRDRAGSAAALKIVKDPLLKSEKLAPTLISKICFNSIHAIYFYHIGNHRSSINYFRKTVELMENGVHYVDENMSEYISAVGNLMMSASYLNDLTTFEFYAPKLKNIIDQPAGAVSERLRMMAFTRYYMMLLSFYLKNGYFERGLECLPELENGIKKYKNKLVKPEQFMFNYNICIAYLYNAQPKRALEWMNRIMNQNWNFREDAISFVRIINLIIHFELGHYDYLENALRSSYRFLLKKKKLFKAESVVLDFIKILPMVQSDKGLIRKLTALKDQLVLVNKNPYEKNAMEYFHFIPWMESKISGKPLSVKP